MNSLGCTAIRLLAVVVCTACACVGAEKITVTGARVNVRAVADPNGEIVGLVTNGDVLSATGVTQGDWIEISPPDDVSVWLYGELVRESVVAASSVRVRSGPGIGYRPVGSLSKGYQVQVLGSKGDWLQIAPPASCTVWISRKYVSGGSVAPAVATPASAAPPAASGAVPAPPVRVTHKAPPPAVATPPMPAQPLRKRLPTIKRRPITPVAPDADVDIAAAADSGSSDPAVSPQVVADAPAGIRQLRLVDRAPQGGAVTVSGVLRPAGFFPLRRPSPYRLVVSNGTGPARTACYVMGDSAAIGARLDERVTLVGKRYWVQGVREPVVAVSEFRE